MHGSRRRNRFQMANQLLRARDLCRYGGRPVRTDGCLGWGGLMWLGSALASRRDYIGVG